MCEKISETEYLEEFERAGLLNDSRRVSKNSRMSRFSRIIKLKRIKIIKYPKISRNII